jgi:23S rRNA pseudouridine1911/1915/1917 synthase
MRAMPRPPTTHSPDHAAAASGAGDVAQTTRIEVTGDLAGQRLDRVLAAHVPDLSRSRAQTAIAAGRVTVNGKPAKASLPLDAGMVIAYAPEVAPAPSPPAATPEAEPDLPLRIVYEDAHLLVVEKPAGMVVHPAPGHPTRTLVDALRQRVPGLSGGDDPTRPGIVHRLDKDTSGLLVVAKDAPTHAALARQMKDHAMVKRYLALVEGQMPVSEGVVEAPIGRDPRNRQRMALVSAASGGREARTRFRVLHMARGRSLLELQLETGRTHQIRVHLAAVQHPVVGDPVYGRPQPPLPPRQFLHAAYLAFAHPVTGEELAFDAPLPADLADFLQTWDPAAPLG